MGRFLTDYWRLPVAPQGEPPVRFSEAERSLDPEVCGACHPKQFQEWKTSLHAQAYSPGLSGQLVEGDLSAPAEVRRCLTCHAPLLEQIPYGADGKSNPAFDISLQQKGMICASCHVRQHRRFGPPRPESLPALDPPPAHGGFEQRAEFQKSEFCAECHQFFNDAGVNGKPLENTFLEWKASPQAAQGRQCQDCHMPDREHTWRGIHDPKMVREAIDRDLVVFDSPKNEVKAALVVRNRDVGHAFPTYVTPRVTMVIYQVDETGRELAETRLEGAIQRKLSPSFDSEVFDSRVLPGESVKLDYEQARAEQAVALIGRITVDPDHHYRGAYKILLTSLQEPSAREQIAEASARIADSIYVLDEFRRPL